LADAELKTRETGHTRSVLAADGRFPPGYSRLRTTRLYLLLLIRSFSPLRSAGVHSGDRRQCCRAPIPQEYGLVAIYRRERLHYDPAMTNVTGEGMSYGRCDAKPSTSLGLAEPPVLIVSVRTLPHAIMGWDDCNVSTCNPDAAIERIDVSVYKIPTDA